MEIEPNELIPTEQTIELYDEIRKEILKMLSLHKHIKKRKEEIKNLDEKLKDIEDFSKIVNSGGGPPRVPNLVRPPIGVQPVAGNPALIRSNSNALAAGDSPASNQPPRPKSPTLNKVVSGPPPSGSKTGGAKRKAGQPAPVASGTQPNNKRPRNA